MSFHSRFQDFQDRIKPDQMNPYKLEECHTLLEWMEIVEQEMRCLNAQSYGNLKF